MIFKLGHPHRSYIIHHTYIIGFQLPHFPCLHCAVLSAVLRYKRTNKAMGMPAGELCLLWLVGCAFSFPHPVFHLDGLVVRDVAQFSRPPI